MGAVAIVATINALCDEIMLMLCVISYNPNPKRAFSFVSLSFLHTAFFIQCRIPLCTGTSLSNSRLVNNKGSMVARIPSGGIFILIAAWHKERNKTQFQRYRSTLVLFVTSEPMKMSFPNVEHRPFFYVLTILYNSKRLWFGIIAVSVHYWTLRYFNRCGCGLWHHIPYQCVV